MKRLLMMVPLLLGAVFFACDDDESNPILPDDTSTSTWIEDGGYWQSLVDASSDSSFVYFSFATQETVSITDDEAVSNDEWDIAFMRYHVILNGGISGDKGVVGVDLAEVDSPDSTDFDAVTDTSDVTDDDWVEDEIDLVVDEWYDYNYQTHEFDLNNNVYIIKDAEEKYVKFQVIGIENYGSPPDMGTVTCRFVYAADGNDVSGTPDTVALDIGSGTGYVDFSAGAEVTPSDPTTSTDWDIAITEYEIHLNCSTWGAGNASAYPAYDDTDLISDPTDFDGLTDAPTQSQGYFSDTFASALTDWWDYESHRLPSKDHVYLIKVDDTIYKLQIYSYYHPDTEDSGNITFLWAELE